MPVIPHCVFVIFVFFFFKKASALPTWKCWTQKRSPYICSYIMFLTFHQGLIHIPKISLIGTGSRGEKQSPLPLPQSSLQPTTIFPNLYLFFWHLNSHVLPVSIILLFTISISPFLPPSPLLPKIFPRTQQYPFLPWCPLPPLFRSFSPWSFSHNEECIGKQTV